MNGVTRLSQQQNFLLLIVEDRENRRFVFGGSLYHCRSLQSVPLGEKRVPDLAAVGQYSRGEKDLVEMDVSDGSREGVELPQLRCPLSVPGGLKEGWLSGKTGSG